MTKYIEVKGAKEHNLKSVDIKIPRNTLTVITGVSGSGKSSLVYDVLFKESQRRFLESFSAYSRQYIGKLEKPDVESIMGLQSALAINQKTGVSNPRSTVGTLSDIYDYLRLLYARIGEIKCHKCGTAIYERKNIVCPGCGIFFPDILAQLFSFNSKQGACSECKGLGVTEHIDITKLIADENKTLREGALVPTTPTGYIVYSQVTVDTLNQVCEEHGFNVNIPWKDLTEEQKNVVLYGSERIKILFGKHSLESRLKWSGITAKPREEGYYKGMIPIMEDILKRDRNDNILRFASSFECQSCKGTRLCEEARAVRINGKAITEISELQLSELKRFLSGLTTGEIFDQLLTHIFNRINYLDLLGLNYLSLARESTTLSGGESQRIRLASQLGSELQGVLYIFDEPSIGLHARDNSKMIQVLKKLRDNGNTVVVVEHDEEMIKAADYLIDIGPGAGINGGEIIFQGRPQNLLENSNNYNLSKTAAYYSKSNVLRKDHECRQGVGEIRVNTASKYNLKNINPTFKLGALNVVTGVSGAGKSTLVHKILGYHYRTKSDSTSRKYYDSVTSAVKIDRIIEIDQSPIGRTPRSNPATYTKLFDRIRDLFALQPESKKRNYKKGRFSFNNKGGRCESCQGAGVIELGMHFMGNVETVCEECNGRRFNYETLEINYSGKNIFEVLEMSINEAREFFNGQENITKILDELIKLDVGYLKLGQPSTTLSGGEAQRIKLASELYKSNKGHCLYLLDEPTVGLHKADIHYLRDSLNSIVEKGNTVVVIEHDLDIINSADWIIDLGPGGGKEGGWLVAAGSPYFLTTQSASHTGRALAQFTEPSHEISVKTKLPDLERAIEFKNVSTNNLKNINVKIPLNKITVLTGVSGSGKSSLAFDTLFSESRNRFTEGFSTYARRMMKKLKKAELEECTGLTPAIALEQKQFGKNLRSTVGTASDLYDLYRLLFSRFGRYENGSFTDLPASMFSFNNHEAACPECEGLGIKITATPENIITDPGKPLINGAMRGHKPGEYYGDVYGQFINTLIKVGETRGIDFSVPYSQLKVQEQEIAFYGTAEEQYEVEWKFKRGNREGVHKLKTVWKGFVNYINEDYVIKREGKRGELYKQLMSEIECPLCDGKRLNDDILKILFNGKNISELASLQVKNTILFFEEYRITAGPEKILVEEILYKLRILLKSGLGYLSLDRSTSSLSGGEAQRLRIASQISSDLYGLTYILDEPTIGLHDSDKAHLIDIIRELRSRDNTIVIVEHDPDIIKIADHIIEMGPGAGYEGGNIIATGSFEELPEEKSNTKKYLTHGIKGREKKPGLKSGLEVAGAYCHNLKNIKVKIPSGGLVSLTGVSGSGKSTLLFDVIYESFKSGKPTGCESITGFENFENIIAIDQTTISTSLVSTAATFTGLSDLLRDCFVSVKEAIDMGFKRQHFSVNTKGGRCEECKGLGKTKVAMDFLADVWVTCDKCNGKRFLPGILEVKYNEKNINDVLNSSVSELINLFSSEKKLLRGLQILAEAGLGYIQFGQTTNTLSGGERQRLKLAAELIKSKSGNNLYFLDEPTTGLFFSDIEKLLELFSRLIDSGNTVVVIEHNRDIINNSDWIIELGPGGGNEGGEVIFEGS